MLKQTSHINGHRHVVIIRDNSGITSTDDLHFHPIMEGRVIEIEGHSHELEDFKPKKDEKETVELASTCYALYNTSKDWEYESRVMAAESEDFVRGAQWTSDDISYLDNLNRAALTINLTESMVDYLLGVYIQNPTDWKFYPIEGGDVRVADLCTQITKYIGNRSNFSTEDMRVANDIINTGRGVFCTTIDFDENPKGDVKVEHIRWDAVYTSPHDHPDGKDMDYVIKARWLTTAQLKNLFPDHAEDIHSVIEEVHEDGIAIDVDRQRESYSKILFDSSLIDEKRKNVKLLEIWQKEYINVPVITYAGDVEMLPPGVILSSKQVKSFKTIPDIEVLDRKTHRMHVTKMAGTLILDQFYNEDNEFDIAITHAKKQGKYWWGKVQAGKDPQREVNKCRSALVDILNKCSNYGYWYDSNTFPDAKAKTNALNNVTQPGFMLEISNVNNPPRKEEGTKFPSEIAQLDQMMVGTFRLVTNVNPEALGQQSAAMSGIAMNRKVQQALIGNEFLFNALARIKAKVGKRIIFLVQKYYSPDRIARLIIDQNKVDDIEKQQEIFTIASLFKTADLLEYDVVCGEGPSSPTARMANAQMLLDMAKAGLPIPPEVIVSYIDFPEKDKVLAQFQQSKQQAEQIEQGKQRTEIMKTQIAANAKNQSRNMQSQIPIESTPA